MEPYVSLVKAIIISTVFSWGTSSVVITDQYIFKENAIEKKITGNEEKEYQIYNLKRNIAYLIDSTMQYKILVNADTLDQNIIASNSIDTEYQIIKTTIAKKKYDEYKCKRESRDKKWTGQYMDGVRLINYSDISYFAKIPWLDKTLDTKEKREFSGFERQEYSPYHYLIYEFIQAQEQKGKDLILRIIEKSEVDTTFIHNLLSLPVKKK